MNSEDAELVQHIFYTLDEIQLLIQNMSAKLQQQTAETNLFVRKWKNE